MSTDFSSLSRQEILSRLYLLSSNSSNATVLYHQAAAEKFGLNATDIKTLPLLENRGPLSAGELSASLGLTTGAITNVIDRLAKIGFVRRTTDPQDRRKVVVTLVPKKIAEAAKVYAPLGAAVQTLYKTYSTEQLATIAHFLEASTIILFREGTKLRKP